MSFPGVPGSFPVVPGRAHPSQVLIPEDFSSEGICDDDVVGRRCSCARALEARGGIGNLGTSPQARVLLMLDTLSNCRHCEALLRRFVVLAQAIVHHMETRVQSWGDADMVHSRAMCLPGQSGKRRRQDPDMRESLFKVGEHTGTENSAVVGAADGLAVSFWKPDQSEPPPYLSRKGIRHSLDLFV